jgi:hypothetical protein
MASDDEQRDGPQQPFLLPRYIRFARTLALVGGAAIGVAAGVAIVGTSGCQTCMGICGVPPPTYGVPPITSDASASADVAADAEHDATVDADHDAGAFDGSGGGPRPAPMLPRAWTV